VSKMGAADVVVRAAIPDDAAGVAKVHVRAWQVGYRGLLAGKDLDNLKIEERARRYTFGNAWPNLLELRSHIRSRIALETHDRPGRVTR
jgi:hypothetical protein